MESVDLENRLVQFRLGLGERRGPAQRLLGLRPLLVIRFSQPEVEKRPAGSEAGRRHPSPHAGRGGAEDEKSALDPSRNPLGLPPEHTGDPGRIESPLQPEKNADPIGERKPAPRPAPRGGTRPSRAAVLLRHLHRAVTRPFPPGTNSPHETSRRPVGFPLVENTPLARIEKAEEKILKRILCIQRIGMEEKEKAGEGFAVSIDGRFRFTVRRHIAFRRGVFPVL